MKETIFISYSHKDAKWKDMLVTHLLATQYSKIEPWDDTKIKVGDNWYDKIHRVINNSSIAILLVSADFLASEFIQSEEIPKLLLKQRSSGLRLFPVILRPCPWKHVNWLSVLQAKPWEGKPIASMKEYEAEECLSSIAVEVINTLKDIKLSYLPSVESMFTPTVPYSPAKLFGLKLHSNDPLRFTFIMSLGDEPNNDSVAYSEAISLVDYFLTCLAIPEKDIWVNLSPSEKNKVISRTLSKTIMGRELLSQDYLLKQFNASLMYPESEIGGKYWNTVYSMMEESYGSIDRSMNTFNKVWILPKTAKISQFGNLALTTKIELDVLLDQDYRLLKKDVSDPKNNINDLPEDEIINTASIGSEAFSKCIVNDIKKEVNAGCNFSLTRKIFYSLILARWYKSAVKDSLINDAYSDKGKLSGLEEDDIYADSIYEQYVKAFKRGVFNYIREDKDYKTGEMVPKQYFSGGIIAEAIKDKLSIVQAKGSMDIDKILGSNHKCYLVNIKLDIDDLDASDKNIDSERPELVAGIDFSETDIDVSKHEVPFTYRLDDDLKERLFSKAFKGLIARVESIVSFKAVEEILD